MTLRDWNYRRWLSHQGLSKFRQDGSYEKKESDHIENDWRTRKGFSKDQSKHRTWCKCRRYLKTVDHRSRRCYERTMINNDRWDEMYDHQDMFVSSWDAC